MDVVIMVTLIFLAVWITTSSISAIEAKIKEEIEAEKAKEKALFQSTEKRCPPHKWVYRKQPDSDDEYMVCELCGMLPTGMYIQQIEEE